ncbi:MULTISPECIES: hypothetical protein [Streptomyces]|nr:hypothetical protein [Streptomyces noursei]
MYATFCRLWGEVAAAYRDWHAAGSPPRSAHRIGINPSRESIGTG